MKKLRKRIFAAVLAALMMVTAMPITALYASAETGSVSGNAAGQAGTEDTEETGDGDTEETETDGAEEAGDSDTDEPAQEPLTGSLEEDTAQCICETLCTEDSINEGCPVCGAEGADLSACKGKEQGSVPETDTEDDNAETDTAKCICETLCTEDSINRDCPVCGAEGADLSACKGKEQGNVPEIDTGEKTEEQEKTGEKVITAWEWIDPEEYLTDGMLALPGAGRENPAFVEDVTALLPEKIQAKVAAVNVAEDGEETEEDAEAAPETEDAEITLTGWKCASYPEDGAYEGTYTFTAFLPEGFGLAEDAAALEVEVELGGGEMLLRGGESAVYQKAAWDESKREVVCTEETADSCTPVENSAAAVTWYNGWYVVNGNVTISEPITVSGEVNLILADGCTLNAEKGIVVTTDNSLTIYAQSGGTGTLNATGTIDSDYNASAGIGGSETAPNSGTITIHGGVINATGGGQSGYYGAAGIGGGTSRSGNGGNSGTIIIYGNTVTANSGEGDLTGAGIGGGSGEVGGAGSNITIYGGSVTAASTGTGTGGAGIGGGGGFTGGGGDSNIQIHGGTVNATGSNRGAGIGGGGSSGTSGDGTVTISGGIVTAVGGKYAAGIGGGGGYSTQYGGCTGGTGSVTISGGIVDATGGAGNSSGQYAGDPIGNGGNAGDTAATVNKTNAIVFENGAGTVCGDVTLDGSYTVPGDYTLNIPVGASLSGSGTLSGGSAFTTENLTADMISVPTNLYYNGEDRTADITTELSGELTTGVTICGQTFTVSGWTLAVAKAADSDLTYTATYTNDSDNTKTVQKTITLLKSGTDLTSEGKVLTYNGETQTDTFTAGDTIKVVATPTPTGDAPQKAAARLQGGPGTGQMALYVGDALVSSEAANADADGSYTMTVSAADVLLAAGGPGTGITLTAKFIGNDNMADGAGTATVNITAVAKAELDGKVIGYYGESNLADAFDDSGNADATFTLLADVERTTILTIKVNCILDLNGKTIHSTGQYESALGISSGATVTIRGDGTVTSEHGNGLSVGGTATLEGGNFISGAADYGGVNVRGKLIVTGENVVMRNTGNGNGLSVNSGTGATAQLSAGTYEGGAAAIEIYQGTVTLADLLNQEGASRVAYYKDNTTLVTEGLDGKTLPSGSYTVKACTHAGEGVCTYTHNENTSTHTKACLACGYTETGDCGFEKTADPTADSHTGQCPDCKRDRSGAHSFSDWAGNPVARTCTVCGYEQTAVARVEKDSTTTYVGALADAFTEGNSGATVTLLDDVTITEAADRPKINIRCTLNLNGHTIRSDAAGAPPLEVSGYGNVTITGSGEIVSNSDTALYVVGTAVLEGGIFRSGGTYHGAVEVLRGNLSVTGENVVMENTGSGNGLLIYSLKSVKLSAGKYSGAAGAISVSTDAFTLSSLLNQEGTSRVAYYKDNTTLVTEGLDGQALPGGSYTVKECTHAYQYAHTPGTTVHSQTCPACGDAKTAETCSYDAATGRCACGSTLAVTLSGAAGLVYNGSPHTPGVTVTLDGIKLTAGTDYTVAYAANVNAGTDTATVTVTGKGSYSFEIKKTFSIEKAEQENFAVVAETKPYEKNGTFTLFTTGGGGDGAVLYRVPENNGVLIVNGGKATIIGAGTVTVTATKAESDNYKAAAATGNITIKKASAPAITYPTAGSITYGQRLSDCTLTGGSTEYGTFAWKDASTVPAVGDTTSYAVVFTASEETKKNYETIINTTQNVPVKVEKAVPAVSITAAVSGSKDHRQAVITVNVAKAGAGVFPTGMVTFIDCTGSTEVEIDTVTLSNGTASYTWEGLSDQEYTIKAVYAGGENYKEAESREFTFDAAKQNQQDFALDAIGAKTYGDAAVTLKTTGGNGSGAVRYESSDEDVIRIEDGRAIITGAGTATITAIKAGDDNYNEASAVRNVTVAKKALTVSADSKTVVRGNPMPAFTYRAEGLVNGDTFTTAPSITAGAQNTDTLGKYDIVISGGTLRNSESYRITYVNGTLNIVERFYTVTVTDGTGGGEYAEGDTVTVTANERNGYTFTGWSSEDGAAFADSKAKTTTFTMPAKSVTVKANYTRNSSGGNNGGGSGGNGGNSGGSENNGGSGGNDEGQGSGGGGSTNPGNGNTTPQPSVTQPTDTNTNPGNETAPGTGTTPVNPGSGNTARPGTAPGSGTGTPAQGTKQPFIKGEDGKIGWDVIRAEEEQAQEGSTINVDMNGSVVVPGDIFDSIKGKDITITFDMGNGIIWSVDGKGITTDKAGDIDFSVKTETNAIPVDIVNNVTGERYSIQISLAYEGEFGFTAVLSIGLGKENAGYTASLYYYNESTGELEFICSDEVAEDGTVSLAFTHASDYVIAIDGEEESDSATEPEQPEKQDGDSTGQAGESPQAGQAWRPWWLIVVGALVIIMGIGVFFVVKKKQEDD